MSAGAGFSAAFYLLFTAAILGFALWWSVRRELVSLRGLVDAERKQQGERMASLTARLARYQAVDPEPSGYAERQREAEARRDAALTQMAAERDTHRALLDREAANSMRVLETMRAGVQSEIEAERARWIAEETLARERVRAAEAQLSTLQVAIASADALLEEREPVVYPRHFPRETSEHLKARMRAVQERQAAIRRKGQVVIRFGPAAQERLSAEDRAKMKSLVRMARLALEAAADSLVDNVKATNQERLEVQFQLITADLNRMLQPWGLEVGKNYQATVFEALDLKAEYLQQVEKEREEQRAIREQMREEAAAQREAERAQREAEEEERRTLRELQRAEAAAAKASADERGRWEARVQELEAALATAQTAKERAVAMAQLTKTGHIYVISNIGAFGPDVFKVGMTRRLDPEDRIIELGDASVPFPFDIHGLIRSDDAPGLEAALHRALDSHRVNLVNLRKEFFRLPFDDLRRIVETQGAQVELTEFAEALEYRQTAAMRSTGTVPRFEESVEEVGAEDPEDD